MKIKAESVLKMYKEGDKRRDAYFYKPAEMIDVEETEGWALMQRRRDIVEDKTWSSPSMWFQNFAGNVIRHGTLVQSHTPRTPRLTERKD